MFGQTESTVLGAFAEYHVKLLERLSDKLSANMIDRYFGYTDVPEDVDNLRGLQAITNENPERVLVITILNRNN